VPSERSGADLDRVWRRIADRLERNGLAPRGRLELDELTRAERHALAGVLGRPVTGGRVTIDLAALDERIRASGAAAGLVALTERFVGSLVDRPGERLRRDTARAGVWAAARTALADARLAAQPWVEPWLDDVRRAGVLGRLEAGRSAALLRVAVRAVAALPVVTGDEELARGDLASQVAGDAHALDDGAVLTSLVLRAVSAMTGQPYGRTAAARRALWRAAGVRTDSVSITALTFGLTTAGGDSPLDARTAAGWETHLTRRDLHRIRPVAPGGVVFVCENPRVLEFAMESRATASMVCTLGQPAGVVTALLGDLAEAGATLRYHGDFDWPGVAIANLLVNEHGCEPWRMAATDYEAALSRLASIITELPELDGPQVAASWDGDLTAAMARARRAVHEELVLDILLADLLGGSPSA
jgi:uncharacterized protein (TIGR02679 family)